MVFPVGAARLRRSPVLLNPLPMLPSAMKTMLLLKSGKLEWKSVPAATTANPPGGSDSEGMVSDSWLSLMLQPVKSIVCPVRFSSSSHSKAVSMLCCRGSYWTSFITTSPSFDAVAVGDGVGAKVMVGVGAGVGVEVRVGVGVGRGVCVGVGLGVGVRVRVGVGAGVGVGDDVGVGVDVSVGVGVGVAVGSGTGLVKLKSSK